MNKEEAIVALKEHMKAGDTIYTQLEHVSKSGMTRYIKVRQIKDNYPYNWTYVVAKALGSKVSDKHDAIRREGCGMDMGFELIYNLSSVLYGNGYAINQRWL